MIVKILVGFTAKVVVPRMVAKANVLVLVLEHVSIVAQLHLHQIKQIWV